jgi:hypothetical protein
MPGPRSKSGDRAWRFQAGGKIVMAGTRPATTMKGARVKQPRFGWHHFGISTLSTTWITPLDC